MNRTTPAPETPCSWCDARRVMEARTIRAARHRLPHVPLIPIAARDTEPRGISALAAIGAEMLAAKTFDEKSRELRGRGTRLR